MDKFFNKHIISYIGTSIILMLFLGSFFVLLGQGNPETPTTPTVENTTSQSLNINSAVREEIQRYMGYEILPARYLSLPYDASMNVNVQGNFIDITFLFFLFIPIFFLLGYRKKPKIGILFMLTCFLLLLISVANAPIYINQNEPINTTTEIDAYLQRTSFSQEPTRYISLQIKKGFNNLYNPINQAFQAISGEQDYITYPLLILFFVGGFLLLENRIKHLRQSRRALFIFIFLYSFLWLLLTAGIIWYGYLMIALAVPICVFPLTQIRSQTSPFQKGLLYTSSIIVILWGGMMLSLRLMNYKVASQPNLLDATTILHQTGQIDKKQALDKFFVGLNGAIDIINQEEESLVYRVGTVFSFFIKKNDKRVLMDNQLGLFDQLIKKYPNQRELTNVLKASGYKYLIVDLHTGSLDRTPEKTLQKKFLDLLKFLYNNPQLQLLATDRVISSSENGDYFEVFGPNDQIKSWGTFAIYRIN